MSDHSAISWTDATWNPVVGCMKVSDGCTNCYAIEVAHKLGNVWVQETYQGLTHVLPDGSVNWTGEVRVLPDRLTQPLHWRKPRRIFVNSMSDLFHDAVSDVFIDQMFAVMALAPRHTFQVLTKRPERMRAYMRAVSEDHNAERVHQLAWEMEPGYDGWEARPWPLPNVWLGVTTEDQRAADERIPLLLDTPAAVRWLSCEPLLGPIDLEPHLAYFDANGEPYAARHPSLDWVITGGESGPRHRPMAPEWARSLRDQCLDCGIAYFHKQNGGRTASSGGHLLDGQEWHQFPAGQP